MNALFALLSVAALVGVIGYVVYVPLNVRRLPRHHLALAATLLCASPMLLVVIASTVGEALGCTVNEAGTSPCLVGSTDIGGLLATFFVMGWLMLVTIWGVLGFGVLWLVLFVQHRARTRAAAPPPL